MTSNSQTSCLNQTNPPSVDPPPSTSPSSQTMTITKRIHPSALTVDKGSSHKNSVRPIPAFLTKLFTMVNDPSTDHLIKWNEPNGDSFFVISSERFGRELLPKYFKHSNFGSFVRQLNMYGFHKVPHLNQGVLQGDIPETEMLEFTNPNFQRGQPDLLCLIQRKKPCADLSNATNCDAADVGSNGMSASSSATHFDLQAVLTEIAALRKHQALISSDLKTLQSSNAHLWKEAIANRDRNKRCQETINKILGFLAQVFAGKVSSLKNPSAGGTIPELERHRSRSKNSRDHHHHHPPPPPPNNLGYPSPPNKGALSFYPKVRHPRLMLEDTHRPLKPSNDRSPSLNYKVSTSEKPISNDTGLRHMSFNGECRNDTSGIPSPTPSALNSISAGSSPSISHLSTFRDSTIDPNLEPEANNLTKTGGHPAIGLNSSSPDQANSENVLQAFFNDGLSNTGLSWNDNVLTGINWSDVLNANNLNGFDEAKSPTTLTPSSPLRITNGHNIKSPVRPSPSAEQNQDSCNQLIADTQQQTNGIGSVSDRMDTLEAAIERLVGSLPETMEALPLDLNPNEMSDGHPNQALFRESHDVGAEDACARQGEFDTDAFLRTLISSDDSNKNDALVTSTTTTDPRYAKAEMSLVHPDGIPSSPRMAKEVVERPRSREEQPMESLDLDKILDEWTCEDGARMPPGLTPIVSPLPTPRLELSEADARASLSHYLRERSAADSPSTVSSAERSTDSGSGQNPELVFDLNDDDHLRRLMSKRTSGMMVREDDPHSNQDRTNLSPLSVGETATRGGLKKSYSTHSGVVPTSVMVDNFHHGLVNSTTAQSNGTLNSHIYKPNDASIELFKHNPSHKKRYLEDMNTQHDHHHPSVGLIGNHHHHQDPSSLSVAAHQNPHDFHHLSLFNNPCRTVNESSTKSDNITTHKKTRF